MDYKYQGDLQAVGGIGGFRGSRCSRLWFNKVMEESGFDVRIPTPRTVATIQLTLGDVLPYLPRGDRRNYKFQVEELSDSSNNGYIVHRVHKGSSSVQRIPLISVRPRTPNCAHKTLEDYEVTFQDGMPTGPLGSDANLYRMKFTEQLSRSYSNNAGREIVPGSASGKALRCLFAEFTSYDLGGQNYWLAPDSADSWEGLAQKLSPCITTRYFKLDATSKATLKSLRDTISSDIEKRAEQISEDISTGNLGDQALETRKERATELLSEIAKIEEYFGETLDFVRTKVNLASQGLASSQSISDDNDIFRVDL